VLELKKRKRIDCVEVTEEELRVELTNLGNQYPHMTQDKWKETAFVILGAFYFSDVSSLVCFYHLMSFHILIVLFLLFSL
jgi:hypothetical protein